MPKFNKSIDQQLKETKLRRWKLAARREEQELSFQRIKTEEKLCNLCRIDYALEAFDDFLSPWVEWVRGLPDYVYSVTKCNPDQYRAILQHVNDIFVRMSNRRIHLAIESTQEVKDKARAKWYESMSK